MPEKREPHGLNTKYNARDFPHSNHDMQVLKACHEAIRLFLMQEYNTGNRVWNVLNMYIHIYYAE